MSHQDIWPLAQQKKWRIHMPIPLQVQNQLASMMLNGENLLYILFLLTVPFPLDQSWAPSRTTRTSFHPHLYYRQLVNLEKTRATTLSKTTAAKARSTTTGLCQQIIRLLNFSPERISLTTLYHPCRPLLGRLRRQCLQDLWMSRL